MDDCTKSLSCKSGIPRSGLCQSQEFTSYHES